MSHLGEYAEYIEQVGHNVLVVVLLHELILIHQLHHDAEHSIQPRSQIQHSKEIVILIIIIASFILQCAVGHHNSID